MTLDHWAIKWQLPPQALAELLAMMGVHESTPEAPPGVSEAAVQQQVRLKGSAIGLRLWRNNRGAAEEASGRVVRYGLANDSSALDKKIKSSDLIGITPYTVQPADVGRTLGIFTSYEVKRSGWKYSGSSRETAQLAWGKLVVSLGGIFKFLQSPDDL